MEVVKSRKRGGSVVTKLGVTTLCGFLGAGKTTLLKHILETKHKEEGTFKCAVIVNDMAELNIDKSLIDSTSILATEEVISMQNGCICCTLKHDLDKQIIELAAKKTYDYMVIEASGVSEPAEIAALFAENEYSGNGKPKSEGEQKLTDLAYLDTCVTVVACNEFLENFSEVGATERGNPISQLLMEQIEFSNVIISNKADLVTEQDAAEVRAQMSLINPRATIIDARQSKVDVMQILDTHKYNEEEMRLPAVQIKEDDMMEETKDCCAESEKKGGAKCCAPSADSRTIKSRVSQLLMPPKKETSKHKERFGISSFIYRARRPFHPGRFKQRFLEEYFIFFVEDEGNEEHNHGHEGHTHGPREDCEEDKFNKLLDKYANLKAKYEKMKVLDCAPYLSADLSEDESEAESESGEIHENGKDSRVNEADEEMKAKAAAVQSERYDKFNKLLRSKGFLWMANAHDVVQMMSQAGNMITVEMSSTWNVLSNESWVPGEAQERNKKMWDGIYGDRRQELVFIGIDLDALNVQEVLDDCLLTDAEFALGPDGWKATMGDMLLGLQEA